MGMFGLKLLLIIASASFTTVLGGDSKLGEDCKSDNDCQDGLYCFSCPKDSQSRCIRWNVTVPYRLLNDSLPFNKYAFLVTHNSYAIAGGKSQKGFLRLTTTSQEDTVTEQLKNGVRGLMLDTYEFKDDVWLCHAYKGECNDFTAFGKAIDTLSEVESFLSSNPNEIVTLIIEDYVKSDKLSKVFEEAGLKKYWFPKDKMPKNGDDWPKVSEMVADNHRLIVFTNKKSKEEKEGIAYQFNYVVENKYGDQGIAPGTCSNHEKSASLDDKDKSLFLMNYFQTVTSKDNVCRHNSKGILGMIKTCHEKAGKRWPNFLAVDYYKRSEGGGAIKAVDFINGKQLCGTDDIQACASDSSTTEE